jgi:hypothetical protein
MTVRKRVTIKPGGTIEITDPGLPPGQEAEVTVVVEPYATRHAAGDSISGSELPVWERIVEIGAAVPTEDWARVPRDLAKNLDHYLYGAPKEED